jgi:L-fuculose-phosphate aldolase
MKLKNERLSIVSYGKKLISSRLTTGTGGNLSIYNRDERLVAIKPSGVDYLTMQPEDVVVLTLEGKIIEGDLKPSSETPFHLALYRHRQDISAVVHTHQVYATTIACTSQELPAVHYLIGLCGDKVPLAKYATYGSPALADNILSAIGNYNACLLENHGLVAVGKDIKTAFAIAEAIELVAQLYIQAKCLGNPSILSSEEIERVKAKFLTYGVNKIPSND